MVAKGTPSRPGTPPTGSEGHRIAIIADDLTGACDAAVAFTSVLPEVRVALTHTAPNGVGVWAISTDTRDVDATVCAARLHAHSAQVAPDTEVLKKIDSAFRGNTAVEIAAAHRCFPDRLTVVAPAYPALGRTMEGGRLFVRDLNHVREVDVRSQLAALGCETALLPARLNVALLAGEMADVRGKALLCDATEADHLRAVVQAARLQRVPVLWIGSAGLAHALAAEFPALTTGEDDLSCEGQCVFFIGSDHAVTRGQVLHLRRMAGLQMTSCGVPADARKGDLLLAVPRGESETNVREAVSPVDAQDVGCLFMTGGDTARLVCRALGIDAIRLHREFVPGVPLGRAEGGRFDKVPVLLKSGAFGSRNLLRDVLEVFGSRKETVCV